MQTYKAFSNLAAVVTKRTYARRKPDGQLENWSETVERVIGGNIRGHDVSAAEVERLRYFLLNRKAGPAGRGWWFSGSPAHANLGGVALNNCYAVSGDDWMNFVMAQDLLMLGGGVGVSVEHRFVSKLPRVKKGVVVTHRLAKDTDFIVPDSREGWCELTRRVLESFLVTGKGFTYSTICVRGAGEPIAKFGGTASGPLPLVAFVEKLTALLIDREGRSLRPIDAADIMCVIGEMVVAGNVRRSAIIVIGDAWDKEYLKAKRWDLGPIPTQRAMANFSVACDDIEDLHPSFWKTYEQGEPFGLMNRTNIQKYGRMGEAKKDTAYLLNPCVPAGTEILTAGGYRPIENLVGLTVSVWNGFEFSRVQPQVTGVDQPLVKVTLSSGQSLVCTPAHKFWIKTGGYTDDDHDFIRADALKSGDRLGKVNMPVIKTGERVDPKRAYTQGFYSGDGSASDSKKIRKTLWLYGEKSLCASRMSGEIRKYYEPTDRSDFQIGFDPEPKDLVPYTWDLEAKLQWLAGLLDADGTSLKEGGTQLASIDRKFLLSLQKFLTTLGCQSKVVPARDAGQNLLPDGHGGKKLFDCLQIWRICVGAQSIQALRSLGFVAERLDFDAKPNRDASRFVTVVCVEPAGVADKVYCFKEKQLGLGCFEGIVTGQCAESTLEDGEGCNLQEIPLPNLESEEEFTEAARLMHRWGKRVAMEHYHWEKCDEVVKRNMRIGTGLTGCLRSPLFTPDVLDRVYAAIQDENVSYSREKGVSESIRTTVVKPSGTMSKVFDMEGFEGIHAAFSRYYIQRIRFSSTDPLVAQLREVGHHIEPVIRFDGTYDLNTVVVDFYQKAPDGYPVADEDWGLQKQLDVLLMAQKHWADQAVSVTVYYRREEIPFIKVWLAENLSKLKSISFLCHSEHGFKQAPKEAITQEQYEKLSEDIRPLDLDGISEGDLVDGIECSNGSCPVR